MRAKVKGTEQRPRFCVFKSLRCIYAQLIDDSRGRTLVAADTRELKKGGAYNNTLKEAKELGELVAKRCLEKNIQQAVFDRGGYKFHGKIKAVAEGARAAGLKI